MTSRSPIIDALYAGTPTTFMLGQQLCVRLHETFDTATASHCRYEEGLSALIAVFTVMAREAGYDPMETGVELLLRATGKDREIV